VISLLQVATADGLPTKPISVGTWAQQLGMARPISLKALKEKVDQILSHPGTGHGTGTGPSSPFIDVSLTVQPGPFNNLNISGRGFLANESVAITITSTRSGSPSAETGAAFQADSTGGFSGSVGVSCPAGQQTTHTAVARGEKSGRVSNTGGVSC
jgi:hypothetical protein